MGKGTLCWDKVSRHTVVLDVACNSEFEGPMGIPDVPGIQLKFI